MRALQENNVTISFNLFHLIYFSLFQAYLCHCRQRLKEGKVKPVCPLKSKGHPDLQVQRKDIFWLHDGADLSDLTCALATTCVLIMHPRPPRRHIAIDG